MDNSGDFQFRKMLESWSREIGIHKEPLSPSVLWGIGAKLEVLCAGPYSHCNIAHILGALWISDLVISSSRDKSGWALQIGNADLSVKKLHIWLHFLKTDQQGQGMTVVLLPCSDISLCPLAALHHYLACRGLGLGEGSLFIHEGEALFTKCQFWALTEQARGHLGLSGICFGTHWNTLEQCQRQQP